MLEYIGFGLGLIIVGCILLISGAVFSEYYTLSGKSPSSKSRKIKLGLIWSGVAATILGVPISAMTEW